jgi:hypothetical protein
MEWVLNNWGNLASLAGLVVAGFTLRAARKARDAAEGAREQARRRSLSEDLQDAKNKSQEVGHFIRDGKWQGAYLRSQEIASTCSVALTRWRTELTETSKENITRARTHADSIARVSMLADVTAPTTSQIETISTSQRRMTQLLSEELGESLRVIERSPEEDV